MANCQKFCCSKFWCFAGVNCKLQKSRDFFQNEKDIYIYGSCGHRSLTNDHIFIFLEFFRINIQNKHTYHAMQQLKKDHT